MNDAIVQAVGVTKAYRIWTSPSARLKSIGLHCLGRLIPPLGRFCEDIQTRYCRDFFALHDVTFEVNRGEAVGIVGRNGSGKSTLLQILAGTLVPSKGDVEVKGRVAALLELGSGFNPEYTGRENVALTGTILGFSTDEIRSRMEAILRFADIGEFIDQPLKSYSSGMVVRLAFAVQTVLDPDLLIIDEALAVGDAPFQAKCFARIQQLQSQGCSILLVSHDVSVIRALCQRAIWLSDSRIKEIGEVNHVCDLYQRECLRAMGMQIVESKRPADHVSPLSDLTLSSSRAREWIRYDRSRFAINAVAGRQGAGPLQISNVVLTDAHGAPSEAFKWNDEIGVVIVVLAPAGYVGLFQIGIVCKNLQGTELMSIADRQHGQKICLSAGQEAAVVLKFALPLRSGGYYLTVGLFTFPEDARFDIGTYDFSRGNLCDRVDRAAFLEIGPQYNQGIYGPVHFDATLNLVA